MENQKYKTILLILIMIIILIISILLGIKLVSLNNDKETVEVSNYENNLIQENVIKNNEIENEVNNTVNNEFEPEQDEVEEEIIQQKPSDDNNQEVDKETMEKEENDIEKAIRIAEENWKKGGNVKFTYEGIENGKHIVYVRDSGTRHIATYKINIETGTFEILQ